MTKKIYYIIFIKILKLYIGFTMYMVSKFVSDVSVFIPLTFLAIMRISYNLYDTSIMFILYYICN